jgi:hypothetical protein
VPLIVIISIIATLATIATISSHALTSTAAVGSGAGSPTAALVEGGDRAYDGYDEYAYYDDEGPSAVHTDTFTAITTEVAANADREKVQQPGGFLKPKGTAKISVQGPLASAAFINMTAASGLCVPAEQARIKTAEYDEQLKRVEAASKRKRIQESQMEEISENSGVTSVAKTSRDMKAKRLALLEKTAQLVESVHSSIDKNVTVDAANITAANSTNASASSLQPTNETLPGDGPFRKLRHQFRFNEVEKMKRRAEDTKVKESKIRKFVLGPDCETMICGTCKVLVEEFARKLVKALEDASIKYVEQVFHGFCQSREIRSTYINFVSDLCHSRIADVSYSYVSYSYFISSLILCHFAQPYAGYDEVLIQAYEQEEDIQAVVSDWSLADKKVEVNNH